MGCGVSTSKRLNKRFEEFESKQSHKTIYLNNQEVRVNLPEHSVGDYYAVEIPNKDYYYFEERFKELVAKELTHHKTRIQYDSKETFISSIFNNDSLRKHVFMVMKRKGIMHAYRWKTWYFLALADNTFKIDPKLIETRKQLYSMLNEKKDIGAEEIINKDVIRTERHKELFAEIHSLGNLQLYRVCKAVGLFFPQSGYVQGMNFVAAFALQVNGLDEFEAFNFIVSLWKKEKSLFYGMYEPLFPVLYFMVFAFNRALRGYMPKIHAVIEKLGFPPELWIFKWFLSFFTYSLEKEYVLRIFDFILINDVFGPVYVALAICDQLGGMFKTEDFTLLAKLIQDKEKLSQRVKFHRFVKKLKTMGFKTNLKLAILKEYMDSLDSAQKTSFQPFYNKFEKHWSGSTPEFYNDFGPDLDCDDYDRIGVDKLNLMVSSERMINMFRVEASNGKLESNRKPAK